MDDIAARQVPGSDCEVIHADVVEQVRQNMPPDSEVYDLSDFFKVISDSTRTRIIWALDQHEMCVCDLAALLNITKSAISHQLRALRQSNLVSFRREGKVIFYSLADEHVKAVFEMGLEHIRER
ncbi:MAG: ArsR/SmtB family transcription factor [Christensenellales bacterium]|jgi:DNA-binding transcriptional ArsR family regulator|nr:helix-turn-helix transcriptional regulator [Eubacteriales bacterium]MCI6029132.1 metalloregulator ArsR/SmtB family transcription factor [Clostridiales bacterium]MDD7415128.1 metalloregulator ArsR/SmtB family transcription factor [Clostridiales bacterium]MDY5732806.1 metalloregulator ArsR/SmtB family transcription factor [Eubacteriales bacterium]